MKTIITKSPLPLLESPQIQELQLGNNGSDAYKMVLNAELDAAKHQQQGNLMLARVIGYFLIEFYSHPNIFNDAACATLVSWLTNPCEGKSPHEIVYAKGKHCFDKLLCLFQNPIAQYPLEDSMGNEYQASIKALARDGYQCLLTGMIDRISYTQCTGLQAKVECEKLPMARLEAAHILKMQVSDGDGNIEFTTSALDILESFGFLELSDKFKKPEGVHEVSNLLSLEHNLHQNFDNFELWFEATEKPHHYKVCFLDEQDRVSLSTSKSSRLCMDSFIVDFSSGNEQLPPPHPSLLGMHATCARVAHMSGAAELFCIEEY